MSRHSNGIKWLHLQVVIQKAIHRFGPLSTYLYWALRSGEGEVTALFSEMLPAHLMRYLISLSSWIATMRALSAHRCHLTQRLNSTQKLDKRCNAKRNHDKPGQLHDLLPIL
ncbi:hypothetical protein O9929_13545 [Vibrio lentus]|nr:hypothetical protein [Vibrio lentus]